MGGVISMGVKAVRYGRFGTFSTPTQAAGGVIQQAGIIGTFPGGYKEGCRG